MDVPLSRRGFVRASAGVAGSLAASDAVTLPAAAQAAPAATSAAWAPAGAETTSIDIGAPGIAHHEIAIGAPLDAVWDLLVDVEVWPT